MSLADDLLTILTNYSGGYKLMRRRLLTPTMPDFKKHRVIKDSTVRITLSRLKKRGLAENKNKIWDITQKGKEYWKNKITALVGHHHNYPNSLRKRKKNMIIAFDIPEIYRKKRDWLRVELINLGFVPLQKSVWLGPAPLPEEFIKSLDEMKLLSYIKFFRVVEEDLI